MVDYTKFADDDKEAAARAAAHAHKDPLPSVPRSLLSSAEVYDYARITAMLYPFYPAALKSASYEAHIEGQFIWWDESGQKHDRQVKRGDPCILPPNSITFVQVEPTFRLPDYIAIRFNLRITHVHRGLLLGTGPLVDPGFEGRLLIPLHNLTATPYILDTNDALIWIEFTKTTYGLVPAESLVDQKRHFSPFPPNKKYLTPDQYLVKANLGEPIRSSIPAAIEDGRRVSVEAAASAREAAKTAKKQRTRVTLGGLVALLALGIALITLYFQVDSMIQSAITLSTSVDQDLSSIASEVGGITSEANATKHQLDHINEQMSQLRRELEELRHQGLQSPPDPDAP